MSGLGTLIRLILRRDRVKLPLYVGGFIASLLAMIPLLRNVYGDDESLATMHATFSASPAGLFMTGPMDEPTFGAFMMVETLLWWGIAIAFINTLLIVRHTRHNEEIGAQELLLSGQTHRSSSLIAVLVVALGMNGLIVLGMGIGLGLMNVPWETHQSWLFAVAMGMFGFVWAAIAAVIAQLVEGGRSANGILAGLIGVSFVIRGIGDFLGKADASGIHQPGWFSNLSPFGWLQATRPLTVSEWEPLLLSATFAAVAIALGFVLLAQRDVGAGLLPSRRGKRRASRTLASPLGLTLYLQKNIFIGWFVAVVVLVATIGALVPQMSDIYSASDSMRHMLEAIGGTGALIPTFMSAMMAIVCLLVFGYAIHALGRLRSEETSGHLENVLAVRVSRLRWIGTHVGVVLIGGGIMLAVIGSLLAVMTNSMSEFTVDVWEYTVGSLSYAPILLAFMALYVALFGLLPRIAGGVVWLYYGFVFFALWLGPIINMQQWMMNLSILEHLASPPAEAIDWPPLGVITIVASVLVVIGFAAFRRRGIG